MKTTLDIDKELLVKAKAVCVRERKSLSTLIEEGLRLRIQQPRGAARAGKRVVPVYAGTGGLVKKIDPTSNRSMLDAADDS